MEEDAEEARLARERLLNVVNPREWNWMDHMIDDAMLEREREFRAGPPIHYREERVVRPRLYEPSEPSTPRTMASETFVESSDSELEEEQLVFYRVVRGINEVLGRRPDAHMVDDDFDVNGLD